MKLVSREGCSLGFAALFVFALETSLQGGLQFLETTFLFTVIDSKGFALCSCRETLKLVTTDRLLNPSLWASCSVLFFI